MGQGMMGGPPNTVGSPPGQQSALMGSNPALSG
jgi:hypothetical protein